MIIPAAIWDKRTVLITGAVHDSGDFVDLVLRLLIGNHIVWRWGVTFMVV